MSGYSAEQIADFGVAAVVDGDDETLTKLCGTPWYIAPEILKGERYGKVIPWIMWAILYPLSSLIALSL